MRSITLLAAAACFALGISAIAVCGDFANIIFLHHSTGSNLIAQGGVRNLIASYNAQYGDNLEFWDHGYNYQGVRDQDNNSYGSYNIPSDNTNPDGFYALFHQPLHDPPDNAFSRFMLPHTMGARTITHDVFVFKSCYPASDISSESMLQQYKDWYLSIREIMDAHPEKIFIPLTPPPLVRSATTPANADRARRFALWLSSAEYQAGHPNVFVYNFWWDLAEHDSTSIYYNCLRAAYGGTGGDSHPNQLANQTCGPLFVNHIIAAILAYRQTQGIGDDYQELQPAAFRLADNYPNPFNSSTVIRFRLQSASNARLTVYDLMGNQVQLFDLGFLSAGEHSAVWNASGSASGVYFFRLGTDTEQRTGKMLLLR